MSTDTNISDISDFLISSSVKFLSNYNLALQNMKNNTLENLYFNTGILSYLYNENSSYSIADKEVSIKCVFDKNNTNDKNNLNNILQKKAIISIKKWSFDIIEKKEQDNKYINLNLVLIVKEYNIINSDLHNNISNNINPLNINSKDIIKSKLNFFYYNVKLNTLTNNVRILYF